MAEHMETILRLVAEGKLSAEDADPLLAALTGPTPATRPAPPPGPATPSGPATPAASPHATWSADDDTAEWPTFPLPPQPPIAPQPPAAALPPVAPQPPLAPQPPGAALPPLPPDPPAPSSNARRQLRIEVVEGGRRVVNLRIPLGLANVATRLVPGLSPEHGARISEAIRSGSVGPILEVQGDDGDRVVIATE